MTEFTKTYIDPVCGVIMTHRTVFAQSTYKGKTYYFCSKTDKETFDKNPARYLYWRKQLVTR